jgi:hypothetical protein
VCFFAMVFRARMYSFFVNKLGCIVVDLGLICLAYFFRTRIYSKIHLSCFFFCHVYIVVDLGFYSHEIFK